MTISKSMLRTKRSFGLFALFLVVSGCVDSGIQNASGVRPVQVDPAVGGPVGGVGIEGHDVVTMTDRMMRDMLNTPALVSRSTPPRIVLDSAYFKNTGSQAINRDLITNRLRVNLNRAAQSRMQFVTRSYLTMVKEERQLKRTGESDSGTKEMAESYAGADYRLTGEIASSDQRNGRTGMVERYNQITFEMVDLESGQIVWSGLYEFERAAADDVVYR